MQIVDGKDYLSEVKDLIIEYSKRLSRDLSFQNIDEELQDPAHKYTAPEGEILVAIENEKVMGMVAYHRHSDERWSVNRKLKWESYCIFVQLLKCLYKCSKTLATIRFVGAENTVKTFPTVIRDPRKLSAVVI